MIIFLSNSGKAKIKVKEIRLLVTWGQRSGEAATAKGMKKKNI